MTIYEKLKESDLSEMSRILNSLLEDEDYILCSESTRSSCEYDSHSCDECIAIKLKQDIKTIRY